MEHNELDRIINGALAGYSDAVPRPGLDRRVLHRIRMEQRSRRTGRVAIALGIAAAVVLMVFGLRSSHSSPSRAEMAHTVNVPAVPSPAPAATQLPVQHRRTRPVARHRPAPSAPIRQAEFPRAAPLTAEERAVVVLVKLNPAEPPRFFADGPIEIPALEIQPLQSDITQ